MKKILFISQWYPHRYDPTFGLFVQKHAEAVGLYCDVATLYVQPDVSLHELELITNQHRGFTEIIIYFPANGNSFNKLFYYIKAYLKGFRQLHTVWGKPDIIQANVFTRTASIALIYKLIYGIPYTVIEHWTRYFREKTFRNQFHRFVSILVARRASAIMPVTYHLQQCMESHGMKNANYKVINNVVDDIFFAKLASPSQHKVRIINVSSFDDAQKNLSGLLRVIHKLWLKRQDFEVYFVGAGVDFEYIFALAQQMGLENKVVYFTGLLSGSELVKQYQQSHFSVLFSKYENIPVVISESLVCGLPVVTTNAGGIAEHINNTNGILISINDEEALLSSLDYLIDHYSDYKKEELIQSAKEKYSYQYVGNQLFNIYSNILKK